MANICENFLDVYGDESNVAQAVHEWVTDEQVLFDDYEGWVDHRADGEVSLIFLTKLSPPVWLLRELSRRFPSLRLMYRWEEPATNLYGFAILIAGTVQGVNHQPYLEEPRPEHHDEGPLDPVRDADLMAYFASIAGDGGSSAKRLQGVNWKGDGF